MYYYYLETMHRIWTNENFTIFSEILSDRPYLNDLDINNYNNVVEIFFKLFLKKAKEERDFYGGLIKKIHKKIEFKKGDFSSVKSYMKNSFMCIPFYRYFRINRTVKDIFFNKPTVDNNIEKQKNYYKEFFHWFKETEEIENEKRLNEDNGYRHPQLEAVRKAITGFLPEFTNLRVKRTPEVRLTLLKGEQELNLNQLSDGEKGVIAMIGDIARRLAISNPESENALNGYGVVLIDEIELHLHPSWQHMIIPGLEKIFPNVQFIVTTHSPQIISHVNRESVIILEQEEGKIIATYPDEAYGKDTNYILELVLDAPHRPKEITEKLNKYFSLIDEGKLEQAQDLREELEELIGTDEPDFVTADALMKRKEILGK